jgi:CMP-N,N'-diacetyllegionaminic acid synthase
MKILYIIPARKGSKGIPGKNHKLLGGKPLIEYTIEFALENMSCCDDLCISTNDQRIIEVARTKGVSVPFIRPDELCEDNTSSNDVILHAIEFYEKLDKTYDAILYLQPTSPFRSKEDLDKILSEFDLNLDMVVTVKLSKENPYFTIFEEDENGYLVKCKAGNFVTRQECPSVYIYNGSMYLINVKSIKENLITNFRKIKKVIMPDNRSVDIDTSSDWVLAEYILNNENS